jgi:hypothetical protein
VLKVIELADDDARSLASPDWVVGLNPHASDGGLFGTRSAMRSLPRQRAGEQRMTPKARNRPIRSSPAMSGVTSRRDVPRPGSYPGKNPGFSSTGKEGVDDVNGINVSLGLPIIARASITAPL